MGKHTPRPRAQAWSWLKYTFLQSAPGLADCELLATKSTRWSALVLQPTRQVSPTTSAESIAESTRWSALVLQPTWQVSPTTSAESIAESTRWSALVLQPTRQVSPTTSAESIPDTRMQGRPEGTE
ncbi:unnamed protein product [Staurois parvus]|uniref:Uncharacterized protein n=1 Tax=Staurois parvus TaxID=386267 RepID=A0ABN9BG76_9NEOB|nr:unnamed protein product [Staurois parvus]